MFDTSSDEQQTTKTSDTGIKKKPKKKVQLTVDVEPVERENNKQYEM